MARAILQPGILQHRNVMARAAPTLDIKKPGKCWLVGAGPGSVDFLTLKAVKLIQKAEVVVYDDLGAQEAIEEFVASSAECIYVGKRGQKPSAKQSDIDALLVDWCLQGKQVVRLKGGCPSTFSRVNSELKALNAAGIEHEMVPGISSALAAPLFAGFPLTDVQLSSSYTVLSAHAPDKIDWSAFVKLDTLVILMAGNTIQAVMSHLQQSGWNAETPVAVIRWAGTEKQQVWRATICTVSEMLAEEQLSPCVIIVGQIARQLV